jgi:hypothetical protein
MFTPVKSKKASPQRTRRTPRKNEGSQAENYSKVTLIGYLPDGGFPLRPWRFKI